MELKVDVVILTKNSIEPCINECLDSLRQNVNINRLIIVDGGSTDKTLDFTKNFCYHWNIPLQIHVDKYGNRATSRQIGIENVETEWFLFLDSDIILCERWLKKAEKHIQNNIGAIEGKHVGAKTSIEKNFGDAVTALRRVMRRKNPKPIKHKFQQTGGAGNVLIRTSCVENIKIPSHLHVYEDKYIKKHVENQGYKWLEQLEEPYCVHVASDHTNNDAYYTGLVYCIEGIYSPKALLFAFIKTILKSIWVLTYTRNIRTVTFHIRSSLYTFLGGFHYERHKKKFSRIIYR